MQRFVNKLFQSGIRAIFRIMVLFFLAFLFSCEEQGTIVNCDDCTNEEPLDASLDIKLSESELGSSVLIRVYEGNLEDNILEREYTTMSLSTSVTVSINRKYTVTATYNRSDGTYTAVDSATPKVRYTTDQCDEPCYYVYDRKLNLKLN